MIVRIWHGWTTPGNADTYEALLKEEIDEEDIARIVAKWTGIPVTRMMEGEIQNSAASGKWDVTFMPADDERKKFVDFGNAYHLLQSTYLVAPGCTLMTVEAANARLHPTPLTSALLRGCIERGLDATAGGATRTLSQDTLPIAPAPAAAPARSGR